MNIKNLDLNLLRVFNAIYMARSVSRAATALDLTQPAVSQGLARLRNLIGDPLFIRASGGVAPTPHADRLAGPVREALWALENAVLQSTRFDPEHSDKTFHLHMTDIGEGRFLPELITAIRRRAPNVRIETLRVPTDEIGQALDHGRIDLAFGYLPVLKDTCCAHLLPDRYIVLLRRGHPLAARRTRKPIPLSDLQALDFVTVRTHAYTRDALRVLDLEHRIWLTTGHFMGLPGIIQATDLAAIMPRNIALSFAPIKRHIIIEADLPMRHFDVSLHWSRRYDADPANLWLRKLTLALYNHAPQE
uniref:LysR family transcriptional regulator n=1 Tax=Castellaniella defragrans TaxID=75697 RepID=UPI00333F9DCD